MRSFWSPTVWSAGVLTGCTLAMACNPGLAQGTWYTSKAAWLAAVTSVRTDTFSNSLGRGSTLNRLGGDLRIWETGASGKTLYRGINNVGEHFVSVNQSSNIMNLSFNSFAFSGMFAAVDEGDCLVGTSLVITTSDGTKQPLAVTSTAGAFLGYIGDAPVTWLKIEQPAADGFVALNSFSLAKPAGDFSLTGASVAPEPDSRRMVILGTSVGFVTLLWKRKRLRFHRWTPFNTDEKLA